MSEYNRYLPEEERQKAQKEKFVFADISDIQEEMAQDASLAQFNEKPEGEIPKGWKKVFSGKFWKGVGKSIWKQNLARDYYEVAGKKKAEKQMEESGSLFSIEKKFNAQEKGISEEEKQRRLELQKQAHAQYTGAITERFGSATGELVEDLVHTQHGEKIDTLGESEQEKLIKYKLIGTAKAFAAGHIDEQGVLEEEAKIWAEIKGVKPEVVQKGKMYASNLLKIAKMAKAEVERQVAQSIDQHQAVMNLNLDFDVVVGRAKSGAKTEAQFNAVENAVEKIQAKTRGLFGFALNETAITAVVTAAYYVKKSLFTRGLSSVAGVAGAAAGAGVTAAFREGKVLEKERMQHAREMAQGRKFNESTATRRKELEQFRIKFKTAGELENNLKASLFDWVDSGRDITELSLEEYEKAMAAVAEIDSRILEGERGIVVKKRKWLKFWKEEYSEERKKADLIGWSDPTKIAEEEGRLDAQRAAAKMLLKKWALAYGMTEEQFKADLKSAVDGKITSFYEGDEGIEKQNERFKKFKHKKMWTAGKKAAKWGVIFGTAIQEVSAFGQEHTYGALEHGWDAVRGQQHAFGYGEHSTMLDSAFRHAEKAGGEAYDYLFPTAHAAPAPKDYMLGGAKYKMYEGLKWQGDPSTPDPNDRILLDGSGNRLSEPGHPLKFNPDGTPSADAKKWLGDHGYNVKESLVPGAASHKGIHNLDVAGTKSQYPDLQINKRADWHDEAGKFWSSIHKKMLEFEGKQQMGYLVAHGDKVYLDCSKVMDNFLTEVQERINDPDFGQVEGYFNADGTPFVDPKMMHLREQIIESINNGTFKDHFQAVVIPTEGANSAGLSDIVQGANDHGLIELKGNYDWSKLFLDPATGKIDPSKLHDGKLPFRFLEMRFDGHVMNTAQGAGETVATQTPVFEIIPPSGTGPEGVPTTVFPPLAYVGRRKGLEEVDWTPGSIEPPSPTPDYNSLNYGAISIEQIRRYRAALSERIRNNPDADLDHYNEAEDYFIRMEAFRLLATQELADQAGPMSEDNLVSICIPVAGHQEGANIYSTLKNYTNQTADKRKFEIILFVNHPDKDKSGNPIVPDNTLEEIARFKNDHPEMTVKVMYKILPIEEAKIGNIRKYLNDAVIWRHHQRGRNVPDLVIVSNDADNKGVAPEYIQNFIVKFGENPEVDAFLGQVDWDPESYVSNPLMHVGTRFFQYVDMQVRKKHAEKIQSSGANFAFRSSIYTAVDGYDNNDLMAEDVVLGAKIKAARYGAKDPSRTGIKFAGARVSRLYTNSRRAVVALKNGLSPIEQWSRGFGAFDDEVRKYQEAAGEKIIDFSDESQVKDFISALEKILNRTLNVIKGRDNVYWQTTDSGQEIDRALKLLGVEYVVNSDGSISIRSAQRLVEGLSKYQKYGLDLMKKKIQAKVDESFKDTGRLLTSKEANRLIADGRLQFEADPYKFIYSEEGLNAVDRPGVGINRFMNELKNRYGITDAEYADIKRQAKEMRGGITGRKREVAQLLRVIMRKDSNLRKDWMSSGDAGSYNRFVKDLIRTESRESIERKNFPYPLVQELVNEFQMSPAFVLEAIMSSRPQLERWAKREFGTAVAQGNYANNETDRAKVYRQILEEYQNGNLKLRRPPNRGPRKRSRPNRGGRIT